VDAEEALAIGLADKVFSGSDVLDNAMVAAREWATAPTAAIAAAKKALNLGAGLPVDQGLLVEREAFNESFKTEDAREGVAAFIAKRKAEFTGR
jgi:enoyl-CoA hydratase/carnithine racemase